MDPKAKWEDRLTRLTERNWDVEGIRARLAGFQKNGFKSIKPDWTDMLARRAEILDLVQLRGEEYEYLTHSCSKGSLLALMEQFGLGSWELVRAMSPFPGFGMTGGICGGVTGCLTAFGLYFGSDDPENYEGTGRTMTAAREFITRFTDELGTISCPKLQEGTIFGHYWDPRAKPENFKAFMNNWGYEKCSLPPGIGARLAADIILNGYEAQA